MVFLAPAQNKNTMSGTDTSQSTASPTAAIEHMAQQQMMQQQNSTPPAAAAPPANTTPQQQQNQQVPSMDFASILAKIQSLEKEKADMRSQLENVSGKLGRLQVNCRCLFQDGYKR